MNRRLLAMIDSVRVGTLHENGGQWAFQYEPSWLANAAHFALCPTLPLQQDAISDTGSARPVQWYFDNLLPEEGQRTLAASGAQIDHADAFGLLTYYGAESAGSLTLLPPELLAQGVRRGNSGLRELSSQALHQRIQSTWCR